MIILIGIIVVDAMLLGLTIWSARRPGKRRARFVRHYDGLPHAL